MMEEKTINSVAEFLAVLEREDVKELDLGYFRGEAKNYPKSSRLTASGLRGKPYDHSKLYKEFYAEVHSRLTQNEKENFLAFCQHHGLPTNLLDVTTNPLTALYFACDSKANGYDGYVYSFKTTDIDDFDSVLACLCLDNNYVNTPFTDVLRDNTQVLNRMTNLIYDQFVNSRATKRAIIYKIYEILSKANEDHNYKFTDDEKETIESNMWKIKHIDIYSPLLSFDRAVAQQSRFIFQWYDKKGPQTINSDFTFKIPHGKKGDIRKSLDRLNINQATIFQDFDNIAQYIKEKHGYK
jgi:hypothetical protein